MLSCGELPALKSLALLKVRLKLSPKSGFFDYLAFLKEPCFFSLLGFSV